MVDLSRQAFLGAFLTLQYLQLLKLHVNGGTSAYKKCRKIAKQVRQTHSGIARVIVWGGVASGEVILGGLLPNFYTDLDFSNGLEHCKHSQC